jgi:hypothetical protein
MNNMPGFSGEASLYTGQFLYRSALRSPDELGANVIAQQLSGFSVWPTIRCCRYVAGHGLVCQTYQHSPFEYCYCSNGVLICHGPVSKP